MIKLNILNLEKKMAIRIRKVDGITIALCAAETNEKLGDLYLDDSIHHALSTKFESLKPNKFQAPHSLYVSNGRFVLF